MLDVLAAVISLADLGAMAAVLTVVIGIWNFKASKKLTQTSIVSEEVQTLRDLLSSQNERLKGKDATIHGLEKDVAAGRANAIERKAERVAKDLEHTAERTADKL